MASESVKTSHGGEISQYASLYVEHGSYIFTALRGIRIV